MPIGRGRRKEGTKREGSGGENMNMKATNIMLIDMYGLRRYTNYFVVTFHKIFNYSKRNIQNI